MSTTSAAALAPQTGHFHSRYGGHTLARVREHTESTQSSLTLKVQTAEGDTVEISLDESTLKQLEQGSARSGQGSASFRAASETDTLNLKISVNGSLNDQEVSDIASLVQSLETGQPVNSSLSTIASYSGSYSESQSVTDTLAKLYA